MTPQYDCNCVPIEHRGSGCCQAKPVRLNHRYKGGKLADVPPQKPSDYALEVPWTDCTKVTIVSRLSRR
jgi:hypothetical protein